MRPKMDIATSPKKVKLPKMDSIKATIKSKVRRLLHLLEGDVTEMSVTEAQTLAQDLRDIEEMSKSFAKEVSEAVSEVEIS